MNRLSLIASLSTLSLCASLNAHAGKALLDTRFDYVGFSANNDAAKPSYSVFQINRMKVDLQGQLNDTVNGRLRFDVLKNTTTEGDRDKVSSFVDIAFLNKKLNDNLSVSIGKITTGMGGVEATNNPADNYLRTKAGDEVASVYWPVGASLDYKMDQHDARLIVANNTEDVKSGTNLNQTTHMTGFFYSSKLMDQMIQPVVSYMQEKYNTSNVEKTNSYTSVGLRIKATDLITIELDSLMNKYDLNPQTASKTLSTTSQYILARYELTDLGSVHAKYEMSERKTSVTSTTDTKTKFSGATLAFEYKPVKDENWRTHIALTQIASETDGATTKPTEQKVMIGMRAMIDILK